MARETKYSKDALFRHRTWSIKVVLLIVSMETISCNYSPIFQGLKKIFVFRFSNALAWSIPITAQHTTNASETLFVLTSR